MTNALLDRVSIRPLAPGPERAFAASVDGRVVAVGGWNRLPGGQLAEVSLVLHDSAAETPAAGLLREIAVDAARAGIRRFVHEGGPDDAPVRRVIRTAGFDAATVYQQGILRSSFAIA
ncbi:MAG: hypothetical protein ACRDYF_02645 [Acidimicrobiia bacterium]